MAAQTAYTEIGNHRIPQWTLADRIRKARLSVGMDQKTFADSLGKTASAVAQWEAGNSQPRDLVAVAKSIELLTRIPASWVLGVDTNGPVNAVKQDGHGAITDLAVWRAHRGGAGLTVPFTHAEAARAH